MAITKATVAKSSVVIAVLLLVAMIVWSFFILKNKDCLICFGKVIAVFIGIGIAIALGGYGYLTLEKGK